MTREIVYDLTVAECRAVDIAETLPNRDIRVYRDHRLNRFIISSAMLEDPETLELTDGISFEFSVRVSADLPTLARYWKVNPTS
jgi:hypothetical protein